MGIKEFFFGKTPKPQPQQQQKSIQTASRDAQQPQAAGDFTTLRYGFDTRRSGGKSRRGLSHYQRTLVLDHTALRMNGRYMMHDSKEARMVNRRFTDCVVGNGLRLNPSPDADVLGISADQAEAWAKDVKTRFDLWARSKGSDATGTNNFYQNMRFYEWQYSRDGEVFVRLNYSDDPELINPVQIGFVDPNQIRGDEFTISLGPTSQKDGIIKDENGKEIGYKVWIQDPKNPGAFKAVEVPAKDPDTGRPIMLHGYNPEYAGQSRGYPEMSHGLEDFEDITSYSRSAAKKMVQESTLGFAVENVLQDPSDMGLQQLDTGAAGPVIVDETTTIPAEPATFGPGAVKYCELNEATQTETGPMYLLGGAQGDKLVQVKSAGPGEKSGEFIDSQIDYLSASRGIPSSVARMKFPKAHSASRGELGLFADVKEIEKDDIVSDGFDPVYEAWLSEEIAAGRVRALGWSDPILRAAWLKNFWTGKPLPDIDPLKTKQAKEIEFKWGLTDMDTEANLNNGSDGPTNRAKLNRQVSELDWNPFETDMPPIGEEPPDTTEEDED